MQNILKNKALLLAIIWLVAVNVIGLLASNRFTLGPDDAYSWIPVGNYDQNQSWNFINMHSRWDSNWYQDLVKDGYKRNDDEVLSNIVFFPLYPLLLKALSFFVGGNVIFAGWIASCIFLVLSCMIMFKLVRKFHPEVDSLYAIFLLLVFPTAFFLNAVYTESLFLFLSLATFYFSFEKKYYWAGIFGFLAALTRVTGILLFLPIAVQFFTVEGWRFGNFKKSLVLLLIPLGTLLFFTYHWIIFGDPLLFFKIENAWGRSFSFNADNFLLFSRAAIANFSLDLFYLLFIMLIGAYLFKMKKYPYAIYVASTVAVALATGTLMSIGRYILVLFPIYIVGASLKNEIAKYAWIIVSTMLMALNTYLFVNWYWAG